MEAENIKQDQEIFENQIVMFLKMFCEEKDPPIKDMTKEPQSVWNGCLRYIRKNVFRNKDILKSKNNIAINNNSIPSNFNSYNYKLINDICDIYIDLCFLYDKEVSIIGFSNLTGINPDTLHDWGNGDVKLSSLSCDIYKKLNYYREESLSNKLVTGKQNPVGVLGVLNRHYQWNMPGVSKEAKHLATKTQQQLIEEYGGQAPQLPELPAD